MKNKRKLAENRILANRELGYLHCAKENIEFGVNYLIELNRIDAPMDVREYTANLLLTQSQHVLNKTFVTTDGKKAHNELIDSINRLAIKTVIAMTAEQI